MPGKLLAEKSASKQQVSSLADVEFKVFSQWGDDGIIQWLISNINFQHETFIEFGVENYREANTRFLMLNNNWSGLVMDGSDANVSQIINSEYFWRYNLLAEAIFIDVNNINELILSAGFDPEVGILHIDLDGNDYWIWQAINSISPIVVILEYNGIFGSERAISVPYTQDFQRTRAHYSNLYFGASLRALYQLSEAKGYAFIGCNSAGNNAYFVRKDKLTAVVRAVTLEHGFVFPKFRQSRDRHGQLNYLRGEQQIAEIQGLPVYNMDTDRIEEL